jgi:hypothetical protein
MTPKFSHLVWALVQVQRLRVTALAALRRDHGLRLKRDRDGTSAVDLALSVRLQWARGRWLEPVQDAVAIFGNESLLCDLGVRRASRFAVAHVDMFLLETLEAIVRCTVGLQARAMSIWSGGVYKLSQLTSDCASERQEVRNHRHTRQPKGFRGEFDG